MSDKAEIYIPVKRTGFLVLTLALFIAVGVPYFLAKSLLVSGEENKVNSRPNYLSHKLPLPVSSQTLTDFNKLMSFSGDQTGSSVPRIYLARLPDGLKKLKNVKDRKTVFISSLLPLILRANELILQERKTLDGIKAKIVKGIKIRNSEIMFLRKIEKRVRIEPNLPRSARHINKLLEHVDIVPPSLALTQAAIESGWGTSRFATQGNALFGEWVWGENAKGIKPAGREEGKTHKVKSFTYLIDSILSYIGNLNRLPVYAKLRQKRLEMRQENRSVTGKELALTLDAYSERGQEYVDDLLTVMRQNNFSYLDTLELEDDDKTTLSTL